MTLSEAQQMCACLCRLWQTQRQRASWMFTWNSWTTCVDIPHRALRSGLTIHRAGGIGKPAGPGPSRRSPRSARRNHTHQSPGGLQRGLSRGPIPVETITVFTTQRKSSKWCRFPQSDGLLCTQPRKVISRHLELNKDFLLFSRKSLNTFPLSHKLTNWIIDCWNKPCLPSWCRAAE